MTADQLIEMVCCYIKLDYKVNLDESGRTARPLSLLPKSVLTEMRSAALASLERRACVGVKCRQGDHWVMLIEGRDV